MALAAMAPQAHALTLGAISVQSALGEPLHAEIEVPEITSEEAAALTINIASPKEFRASGIDYSEALKDARISLEHRANGQAYVRILGAEAVNAPFINVLVNANWASGHVTRDYTVLVDPRGRAAVPAVVAADSPQTRAQPATRSAAPAMASAAAQDTSEQGRATPTAAPSAKDSADAPSRPSPRRRVTVQRGDTASQLALPYARGVSLDQMLIATLRANPKAFIRDNVNLLRAGAVLRMPTQQEARAVSRAEARQLVVAQTQDFAAYRQRLAENTRTNAPESGSAQASGGAVQAAKVHDSGDSATAPDRLTVSKAATGDSAVTEVATTREAKAQSDRVAELNRNLAELSNLEKSAADDAGTATATTVAAAEKTDAPATGDAQPDRGNTAAATPAGDADATADKSGDTHEGTSNTRRGDDKATTPGNAAAAANAPSGGDSTTSPAHAEADHTKPDGARPAPPPAAAINVKADATPPASAAAPWYEDLLSNPRARWLGLLLILLLLAFAFHKRRQARSDPWEADGTDDDLPPEATTIHGIDAADSDTHDTPPRGQDARPDERVKTAGATTLATPLAAGTPTANADELGAYERLAAIYAGRGDAKAFKEVAAKAHRLSGGKGAAWQSIAELGQLLDPADTMYRPGDTQRASVTEVHAEPSAPPAADDRSRIVPSSTQIASADLETTGAPANAGTTFAPAPVAFPDLTLPNLGDAAGKAIDTSASQDDFARSMDALTTKLDLADPGPGHFSLDVAPPAVSPAITAPESIDFDPDSFADIVATEPALHHDESLSTKFSLAQEFRNIGDADGARSLAQEVAEHASGDLKSRAERFLAELS